MKRLQVLLLCLIMLLALTACQEDNIQHSDPCTEAIISTAGTIEPTNSALEDTAVSTDEPTDSTAEVSTTEHAAMEHSWSTATCTAPKTCIKCGATEGVAAGHSWKAATCTVPKTCSVCGETEGTAAGHDYSDGFCNVCGEERPVLKENDKAVLNYLKEHHGEKITAEDVAAALGMDVRAVNGIFTSDFERNGLGIRISAEIQLEDGTYRQVKYLELTPAGLAYDPL